MDVAGAHGTEVVLPGNEFDPKTGWRLLICADMCIYVLMDAEGFSHVLACDILR